MKITIYTIPDCQFSKSEKEYLASKNLSYEEKNLESNRDFLTEMLTVSNNFAGTPVTKMEKDDGQIVVLKGFTKEEFDKELGQSQTSMPGEAKAPAEVSTEMPKVEAATAPVSTPMPMTPEPAVPHLDLPDISMPEAPDVPPAQMPSTMTADIKSNFPAPQDTGLDINQPSSFDPNAFQPQSTPTPVEITPEQPPQTTQTDTGLSSILDNLQAKVNSTPDQSQPAAPVYTNPQSTPPTQV